MGGSEVSKPVFIAIIVVVVLVVGAIGYHFLGPSRSLTSDSVKQQYAKHFGDKPIVYSTPGRGGSGGSGGSGGAQSGASGQSGGSPQSGGTSQPTGSP
jgi:hypothetical protein